MFTEIRGFFSGRGNKKPIDKLPEEPMPSEAIDPEQARKEMKWLREQELEKDTMHSVYEQNPVSESGVVFANRVLVEKVLRNASSDDLEARASAIEAGMEEYRTLIDATHEKFQVFLKALPGEIRRKLSSSLDLAQKQIEEIEGDQFFSALLEDVGIDQPRFTNYVFSLGELVYQTTEAINLLGSELDATKRASRIQRMEHAREPIPEEDQEQDRIAG